MGAAQIEQEVTTPVHTNSSSHDIDDNVEGFAVAVIREPQSWRCCLLSDAALRHLSDTQRELEEIRGSGAIVFGLIDVDDEFAIILRPGPTGTRLLLSDATSAPDYEIAAEALRTLGLEVPDLDDEEFQDFIWPEGDLGILTDLGLDETMLADLLESDLYIDQVLEKIAERLGFSGELSAAIETRPWHRD